MGLMGPASCLPERARMTSDPTPIFPTIGGPIAPTPATTSPSRIGGSSFAEVLATVDSVDAVPVEPPQEVIDAIGVASRTYDRLAASGRQVHFTVDARGGLSIEVHDLRGGVLGRLTPSQLLDVTAGGTLP